jgi:hypothetical protein
MTNIDAPQGFVPVRQAGGCGGTPARNAYSTKGYAIASGYATALYRGAPVEMTGTSDAEGRPYIQISAVNSSVKVVGVFDGWEGVIGNRHESHPYWIASTVSPNAVAYVFDDPNTIFSIQNDSVAATPAATDIGEQADWTPTASTGGNSLGVSSIELDTSTIGTGTALQIVDLAHGSTFGEHANYHVLINEHARRGALTKA